MFIKEDTLVEVTDPAFIAKGEFITHGAVRRIAIEETTFEPVILVSLMELGTGVFRDIPFFKGQIRRKPSNFHQLAEILYQRQEQEKIAA